MASRSHAHGLGEDRPEILLCPVYHGPRGIVHRAGHHADKRDGNIVVRGIAVRPFRLFQPFHPFACDHVGKSPSKACRFVCPVKIDQHFPVGSFFCYPPVIIDHPLVITLHEINFYPIHTPLLKLIKCLIPLIFEGFPHHPEDNTDIFLFAISYDLFHVYPRCNAH